MHCTLKNKNSQTSFCIISNQNINSDGFSKHMLWDSTKGQQTFPAKGQIVKTVDFAGHVVSVTLIKSAVVTGQQPQTIHKWMKVAVFQ